MSKYKKRYIIHNTEYQILNSGMSLLEILVVVAIFAILGIIVARAVILTIGGSKKSESLIKVRENLDYAVGVAERQIRNANSIVNCATQPQDTSVINYLDQDGIASSFSCVNIGSASGYVASGSAQLTSDAVNVTACSFTCAIGTSTNPDTVSVTLEAKDAQASGVQGADVTVATQISLRNY